MEKRARRRLPLLMRRFIRNRGIELASGLLVILACVVVVDSTLLIPGLAA